MARRVKAAAVSWLASKFNVKSRNTYASKFYVPEESWTKRPVWWLEIPRAAVETPESVEIHLLCQVAPNVEEFHYLRVPVQFLQKELPNLAVREKGQVSLFLSAEPDRMFVDQRGKGSVAFGGFAVS